MPLYHALRLALIVFTLPLLASAATAQVVTFGHLDVVVGGITAGDAPGYPAELNEPGSYRLEGHLFAPLGFGAVKIQSEHVRLDLAGFTLFATAGFPQPTFGVDGGLIKDTEVHGGSVRGFATAGIRLGPQSRIHHIHSLGNDGTAIEAGDSSQIYQVQVSGSRGLGVQCGNSCQLWEVIVQDSETTGIACGDGCRVQRSTSRNNGLAGLWLGDYAIVRDNILLHNKYGLLTGDQCLVTANVLGDNDIDIALGTDVGTAINVVDDVQIIGDHELDPSACIGALCL